MNIEDITTDHDAYIALSILTEPGDGVVGGLVNRLGPTEALGSLLGKRDLRPHEEQEAGKRMGSRLPALRDFAGVADGITVITPGDPLWFPGLHDLGERMPFALYVRGNVKALRNWEGHPSVSVVGSRAATAYGEHVTQMIVSDLVADPRPTHRTAIVSGGAYGIDAAAHRAALASGGLTVAFLAGGVDRMYPIGNAQLSERIVDTGALISQVPPGTAPTRWRFLARNQLIAAVSQATVVVESGSRGGSLSTARAAARMGRLLGAVPGPVTSAASVGCHLLLQEEDAYPITGSADVFRMIEGAA